MQYVNAVLGGIDQKKIRSLPSVSSVFVHVYDFDYCMLTDTVTDRVIVIVILMLILLSRISNL